MKKTPNKLRAFAVALDDLGLLDEAKL